MVGEAEGLVDGPAELGGVEGDDGYVAGAAVFDGRGEELLGVAVAASFGGGVEVEEVGADGLGVEVVGWEVHVEDAGGGEDHALRFEEEADVAAVGQALCDPWEEVRVHLGVAGLGGELIVGEHEVALLGDEGGVGDGGAAKGGHRR